MASLADMIRQNKMRPIDQNPLLGKVSSVLGSAREYGNKVNLPVLGGLGDMFVGKAPEEIENWSYGNSPFQSTEMGLPQIKRERKQSLVDALSTLAGPVSGLAKATEGLPVGMSIKDVSKKNLNKGLVDKYLQDKWLSYDDLQKYEKNALKMETPNLQKYNVENAKLIPEQQSYIDEFNMPWLHGTERLDRLLSKSGLDPKRATSGPMPFGTDANDIASNYAKSKKDTSIIDTEDWDYSKAFTVSPKDLGYRGSNPYTVEQTWHYLPSETKKEILSNASRVGYSDPYNSEGNFILHPQDTDAINKSHFDYLLKEHRGNPLSALRDYWVDSGNLFNEEQKLEDIYKAAGYPHKISQDTAPWAEAKGVLTGLSRITNPLDTSNVLDLTDKVIPALKLAFKNDKTRTKIGADAWDKNSKFTPKDWVNTLEKDIQNGENSFVWTSIPDKVTNELKRLGYNGIYDTGGKMGGEGHQVTIPFEPNQIRSRFAAFDPLRKNSSSLLASIVGGTALANQYDKQKKLKDMR